LWNAAGAEAAKSNDCGRSVLWTLLRPRTGALRGTRHDNWVRPVLLWPKSSRQTLCMQRDLEKVEEIYNAYERLDLASVFQVLAKDVEFIQSTELPWGGHYTGHDGARKFFGALREHIDSRVILERLIDAGDRGVAVGRTVGKTCATQLEFNVPVVHFWTLQDGLVSRFEAYIDNATMLVGLGM